MIHLRGRLGFPWNNRYMRDLDVEIPLHAGDSFPDVVHKVCIIFVEKSVRKASLGRKVRCKKEADGAS